MRTALFAFASVLALTACSQPAAETEAPAETQTASAERVEIAAPVYPETSTVDQVDVYVSAAEGEVAVSDPYRWLEQDVRVSEDVANWVTAQTETTNAYLDQLPGRERIAERLAELWNYERYGLPTSRETADGLRYFFSRNDGLQDQSVFMVQDGLEGEARALIDHVHVDDRNAEPRRDQARLSDRRWRVRLALDPRDGCGDGRTARR